MEHSTNDTGYEFLLQLTANEQYEAIRKMPDEVVKNMRDEFLLQLTGYGQEAVIRRWGYGRAGVKSGEFLLQLKEIGKIAAIDNMSDEQLKAIKSEVLSRLGEGAQRRVAERVGFFEEEREGEAFVNFMSWIFDSPPRIFASFLAPFLDHPCPPHMEKDKSSCEII